MRTLAAFSFLLLAWMVGGAAAAAREKAPMKITPVLFVDEIEPSLPFWIGRLGFEKTVAVPEGEKLGFVILQKGDAELMLQTHNSLKKDVPALAALAPRTAGLYIEVPDFEDVFEAPGGRRGGDARAQDLLRNEGDRRPRTGRQLRLFCRQGVAGAIFGPA